MNIAFKNTAAGFSASQLFAAANSHMAAKGALPATKAADAGNSDAATILTLSPEAQQRLDNDRAAVEKLAAAASGQQTPEADDRSKDITFDELFEMAERNSPPRKQQSEDGALKALPREQMMASLKEITQKFWTGNVERKNPEQAEAFRQALADGTVRIRMASDVPGTNKQTTVEYLQNGQGMKTSSTGTPSPEIQAEIDAGRALLTWKHGVGDLYITW